MRAFIHRSMPRIAVVPEHYGHVAYPKVVWLGHIRDVGEANGMDTLQHAISSAPKVYKLVFPQKRENMGELN